MSTVRKSTVKLAHQFKKFHEANPTAQSAIQNDIYNASAGAP
jgi:hypothetical protein